MAYGKKPTKVPRCGNFRGTPPTILFLLRILIGISGKLTKIRFKISIGKLRKNLSLEFRKTTDRAPVGAIK
jgi:hypothetical protein